jgi:hypothetical protein
MAGRVMTEEQVTKAILKTLIDNDWGIISDYFPQSFTGKMLHLNTELSPGIVPDTLSPGTTKNKGGIIPDIVAVKNGICLFFENKDRVVVNDFEKISALIRDNQYKDAITALLSRYTTDKIYYGVAFPLSKWNERAKKNAGRVDFIIGVARDGDVVFLYNPHSISI